MVNSIMLFVPNKNKRTGVFGPAFSDGSKLYFLDNHVENQTYGFYKDCVITHDHGNFAFVAGEKMEVDPIKYKDVISYMEEHEISNDGSGYMGCISCDNVKYDPLAYLEYTKDNQAHASVLFKSNGELLSIDCTDDLKKKFLTTYTNLAYTIDDSVDPDSFIAEYYIEEAEVLTQDDIMLTVLWDIENYKNIRVINDRYIVDGEYITSLHNNMLVTYTYPDFDSKIATVKTTHIRPELIRDYCAKYLIAINDDTENLVTEQTLDINEQLYTITYFNCHTYFPREFDEEYVQLLTKVKDSFSRLNILKKQLAKEGTPEANRLIRELAVNNLLHLNDVK